MKPKHVAKTVYYWLYIDVLLWLNKISYEYWVTQRNGSYHNLDIVLVQIGYSNLLQIGAFIYRKLVLGFDLQS